jgi:dGTPase
MPEVAPPVAPARARGGAGLAPFACREEGSRGRARDEPGPGIRGEYQRDRDRVVHSAAFRRLEYKTQVFVNHEGDMFRTRLTHSIEVGEPGPEHVAFVIDEGDMFRTRLTHSIEVAQIGRTVARVLGLNEDLTEAIALAHDLGHTPFGHAGQDALNACMREHGGFEHNLQSLRIVDRLEEKYADFPGLNLTFEVREGILKHCSRSNARRLGELGRRFLEGGQPSLEAQLANLADEIAYNNHDVDDGLRAGLLDPAQLDEVALFRDARLEVAARWPELAGRRLVHETVRRMIDRQVRDLVDTSTTALREASPPDADAVRARREPLLAFSEPMTRHHLELKRFLRHHLYRHYRVHRMASKAGRILRDLFAAFLDDTLLLPHEFRAHVSRLEAEHGVSGRARGVCDYVAGMTDRFAIGEHSRIFDPASLT